MSNKTTSIKGYDQYTIYRPGQHIGSEELPTLGNNVINRLLSTSTYMNHRCGVSRPSNDSASIEQPFATHKEKPYYNIFNFLFNLIFLQIEIEFDLNLFKY